MQTPLPQCCALRGEGLKTREISLQRACLTAIWRLGLRALLVARNKI